jgi:hypothetical protein
MFENPMFTKVVKLNILKSRYGSRVGDFRYLGSNIDFSKFYDFMEHYKAKKDINKRVDKPKTEASKSKSTKEEPEQKESNSTLFTGRKKRKF